MPRAEAALTTAGGQISVNPFSRAVDVEEPADQRPLEAWSRGRGRPGSRSRRSSPRARGRGCRAARPPPSAAAAPRSRRRRAASAPDLAAQRLDPRELLAPLADGDVGLLAADRDVGVGRVRDAQEEVLEPGLDGRQLGVDRRDPLAGGGRGGLERGDLRAVRVGAAADRLADRLRGLVALRLEPVALGQQLAPAARRPRAPRRRGPGPRPCRWRPGGRSRHPRAAAAARRSCAHLRRPADAVRAAGLAQPVEDERRVEARPAASPRADRSAGRGRPGRSPRTPARWAGRAPRRPRRSAPARRRRPPVGPPRRRRPAPAR